jgi:protein-export membrane protein SecD
MRERTLGWLIFVIVIAAAAIWLNTVSLEYTRPKGLEGEDRTQPVWAKLLFWQSPQVRTVKVVQGLDLQGGLQVQLEADVPANVPVAAESMDAAIQVIRNRIDAMGVSEPLVQKSGDRRIVIELRRLIPTRHRHTSATGFLEFVDAGYVDIPKHTHSHDDRPAAMSPTTPLTLTGELTGTLPLTQEQRIYNTVISGKDLSSVSVVRSQVNEPEVSFTLNSDGARIFGQFTAANNEGTLGGRRYFLCIILYKVVVSCPSIRSAIPDGQGVITLGGQATIEEAQKLALQLRSGSLPIALRVVGSHTVGPTLGQDSINKSVTAGIIGVVCVLFFMLAYYRLPGLAADLALLTFAALSFAIYKLFPVTLTLPGIAGFLLSTGMAVDANVLIFERMREELRAGRSLRAAVEAGFDRAWAAIRDSNLSTIITCIILGVFGSNFGASVILGFAITLGLGVLTSMFTAVIVTHTLLRVMTEWFGERLGDKKWLMGV